MLVAHTNIPSLLAHFLGTHPPTYTHHTETRTQEAAAGKAWEQEPQPEETAISQAGKGSLIFGEDGEKD